VSVLQELRRRWWLALLGAVIILLLLATRVATFYTDVLWFDSVGYADVFWTLLTTRIGLGGRGGHHGRPGHRREPARREAPRAAVPDPLGPGGGRRALPRAPRALRAPLLLGVALLIGVLSGLSMAREWETFLLWLNGVPVRPGRPAVRP
jgi:uncharacterized protein